MVAPAGTGYLNVFGTIHSHPASGDVSRDFSTAYIDQFPSSGDWAALGAIAFEKTIRGGDVSSLRMYIVDQAGFVREFAYADRATYDVSVEQLQGSAGLPPPPLPVPLTETIPCGG